MTKLSLRALLLRYPLLKRLAEEIFGPEVETVLHLSSLRMKWLGIFTLVANPLFWFIWTVLCPQPYENLAIRLVLAAMGVGFFLYQPKRGHTGLWIKCYFAFVCWLQLPVFFTWMYWMNGGNAVWLATSTAMVLIYFQLTDWRLACLGLISGGVMGSAIASAQLGGALPSPWSHVIVGFFALISAISIAISSANIRRTRLRHSLVVIGIMAHELRTPLATASLLGQAIANEAPNNDAPARVREINRLTQQLETLTRTINHHIDLQMMNARYMQLPATKQLVSAIGLVNKVVTQYPFSAKKEEDSVEVLMHEDFLFYGSERQFIQVLNNLIKNALYALKARRSHFTVGDLRIEVSTSFDKGRITVTDKGPGMDAQLLLRVFDPFFSSNNETGHGLGLAYCKQVVQAAGGEISAQSPSGHGATFKIELPVQLIDNTRHDLLTL